MTKIAPLLFAVLANALAFPQTQIAPQVFQTLKAKSTANIAVILRSPASQIYAQVKGQSFARRGDRMTLARSLLIEHSSRTQAAIVSLLQSQGVKDYKTFWITNRVIIRGATLDLVSQLAQIPEIASIREEIYVPVEPIRKSTSGPIVGAQDARAVRGVFIVKAPELWAQGFNGTGMVVSNVDTGVRLSHEALKDNFLGDYGWFEPTGGSATPNDGNGHGTHTMGTIAGRGAAGIGVAPGAKWMACKGCSTSSCSEYDLLTCGEFIACPTLTDGSNEDCTKAPHVVGNSWGSTLGGDNWYDDVISGWQMADVVPVFSAGNAGSGCSSVGSPGDRPGVIGVAATDFNDVIASFSSRGPAVGVAQKPEISAPGVDVLSSVNTGDDHYDRYSGTSMACPHVAGGVALLLQKSPNLDYEGIRNAIFQGAETEGLTGSSQTCGGVDDNTFPNLVFGYGRMDLAASANSSTKALYF